MRKILILCRLSACLLAICIVSGAAIAETEIVRFYNGTLRLQIRQIPLGKVLEEIRRECSLEISGLEDREGELITFFLADAPLQDGMKRFLNHLGETNLAFEFFAERLIRVSAFPQAQFGSQGLGNEQHDAANQKKNLSVPQIVKIVEGSQAETLDLSEGDLIVEYDGVKIATANQLVQEVKKKTHREEVEMMIVREAETRRITLKGGFIGVRIKTVPIPEGALRNHDLP